MTNETIKLVEERKEGKKKGKGRGEGRGGEGRERK
jgi:hypothetical protein